MAAAASVPTRIDSLDQFRGYTVAGMFLVNYLGSYAAIHYVLKHHNTFCSYADTIMPHFFFCVGVSYRLTFLRRLETDGFGAAARKVIARALGLILIGFVIYTLDGAVGQWKQLTAMFSDGAWPGVKNLYGKMFSNFGVIQTLVHIALTTIWVLPVIAARPWVRIGYMCFSALLHVGLSYWFYYDWAETGVPIWEEGVWKQTRDHHGIDGGPLGFLTWTIPVLVGSLVCDALRPRVAAPPPAGLIGPDTPQMVPPEPVRPRLGSAAFKVFFWGLILMAAGYGLSCLDFGSRLEAPKYESKIKALQKDAETEKRPKQAANLQAWIHGLEHRLKVLPEATYHPVEPPFVRPKHHPPDMWTMNQRSGSVSYLTFGAGLSLFLYAFFVVVCDVWRFPAAPPKRRSFFRGLVRVFATILVLLGGAIIVIAVATLIRPDQMVVIPLQDQYSQWANEQLAEFTPVQWTLAIIAGWLIALAGWELDRWARYQHSCIGSIFRTLGGNALAAYILHSIVERPVQKYAPNDSPLWYALLSFAVFFAITYVIMRYLEKNKLYLRL